MWSVAKRFGIIKKESIYDKRVARMLYDRYYKTSISKESIRELVHDKYDVKKTSQIIKDIKSGAINLHWVDTREFSGLAQPILSRSKKSISAPLGIENGILELVKERLITTKHKLVCMRCGKWERIFETKDIPNQIGMPILQIQISFGYFLEGW